MRRVFPFTIGTFGGIAAYLLCTLLFYFVWLSNPFLVLGLFIFGVVSLVIAGVSAVALLIGLLILLAEKFEAKEEAH